MTQRTEVVFWDYASEILHRLQHGGVLCSVVDRAGRQNLLTLGWGLIGPAYHERPIFAIAVTPLRYSWRFLEEVPEFVISVPDDTLYAAVALCGSRSGRNTDKFATAGLTRVSSTHVRAPSILECPLNIECSVTASVAPPHQLLTPEHRQHPLDQQHTIYFAQVLGTYTWGEVPTSTHSIAR